MSTSFNFEVQVSLRNEEGQDDVVYSGTIEAGNEAALLDGELLAQWKSAEEMADVRSDDGTNWNVDVECLSVTNNQNGHTDWNDDSLPQRDELTAQLMEHFNNLVPDE
jgi:hypothetical protein